MQSYTVRASLKEAAPAESLQIVVHARKRSKSLNEAFETLPGTGRVLLYGRGTELTRVVTDVCSRAN